MRKKGSARVRHMLKTVAFLITLLSCLLAYGEDTVTKLEVKPEAKADYKGLMPEGLWRLGDGILFPPYALVVDKSKKKIHVIDNTSGTPTVIESYDSDLGKMSGDKAATGDGRTPEGIYFLQKSLEGPGLDSYKYGVRAFTTDYPNIFDLRKGKTGYGIWLHAIDEKQTLERGSQGCVVVRNETIKKLAPNIVLRETPLMIFDKVQWVTSEDTKKEVDPVLIKINLNATKQTLPNAMLILK
jgi:hypothetical protein